MFQIVKHAQGRRFCGHNVQVYSITEASFLHTSVLDDTVIIALNITELRPRTS